MDGRMATGGPASALAQKSCMVRSADVYQARLPMLDLGVAAEAEIWVARRKQLAVHRAVRVMTDGATFAQGLMFEHKRPSLFAMTLGAAFIETRHGQAA